ncbi:antichymotrypsin-2-like isoform X2 [Aphidius gifuensis]|uniref:antichymotrypsin-2-like isoform X2 n=1 Tax=Aphidius gifuensis TaxID=684658 RepID=UPI001CDC67F9|nr:antichymotrypsin-2-like isoform X2 [Aphidius gifuensis]
MNCFFRVVILQLLLVISEIAASSSCGTKPSKDNKQADLRAVTTGGNVFTKNFFQSISANYINENLICSPVSLQMVMAMLSVGARGQTETQLRSVLHLPSDKAVTRNGYQSLIDTLNSFKKVNLTLANKIYLRNGFEVESEFKKIIKNYYRSEIESLDFSNAVAASNTINAWAEAKTNNLIKNVVTPDTVEQAVMLLINAVYFKGNWKVKFDPKATVPQSFFTSASNSVNVSMMQKTSRFNYGEIPDLNARFVELEYNSTNADDSTSMIIILPNDIGGLQETEKKLSNTSFEEIRKLGFNSLVQLSFPKFKIENLINLKSVLIKMGLANIFSDSANLTGIAKRPPLTVSEVYQKAYIIVNEDGTKAAAVTVGGVGTTSVQVPVEFNVNRPFIYAIIHRATNTVLFQGHVKLPKY